MTQMAQTVIIALTLLGAAWRTVAAENIDQLKKRFPYNNAFLGSDISHYTFVPDAAQWNATTGKYNHTLVHIWLRCTCHYQDPVAHLSIRGFLYAEPHEIGTHPLLPLRQPFPKWWKPRLEAVVSPKLTLNFTVHNTYMNEAPISFELDLQTVEHELLIQMRDWGQYHSLAVADCCANRHKQKQEHSTSFAPEVIVVLNKMFNLKAQFAADLLTTHIHYHRCLGVTRYVLFASKAQAAKLHKVPAVAKLVESGLLRYIESIDLPVLKKYPYSWQPLLYNYVILVFWQHKSRLLLIDYDEYLALGQGINLISLVDNPVGIVHVTRTNFHTDHAVASHGSQPLSVTEFIAAHKRRDIKIHWSHPKGFVDPNLVFSYHVHTGMAQEQTFINTSSTGYLAHFPNLFRMRHSKINFSTTVTRDMLPPGSPWVDYSCLPKKSEVYRRLM